MMVCAATMLAGCSPPAPEPAPAEEKFVTPVAVETSPSAAAIEATKAALAKETKVEDLTYSGTDTVQWNIGVRDDGASRVGYAEYVCSIIEQNGALAGRTHVRVVDIAKVAQGSDFRSASLGHVICETGDVVAP